ncbi:DUF1365 domain-containing protein [Nocardioides montaniterrae]
MTATPPEIYRTTIEHVRRRPLRRTFRVRSWLWVADLDALPTYAGPLAWLCRHTLGRIEARDHLGDPDRTVRENVAHFLALNGVELGDARVRLAAHPRAFGHCFNPISVFWCTRRDGTPLATVVEVHNTYGDRHAYLLRTDDHGVAATPKLMHVSPFHGQDGTYRVSAPEPADHLELAVVLRTADGATFRAWLHGERTDGPVDLRTRLAAALVGLRDSGLIRLHGIALVLRGLPIHSRPIHHQEGVR